MCCLFGMIDYAQKLTSTQKSRIVRSLGIASEARGTDATGVAYNAKGTLHVYKRPVPAHKLRIYIPESARAVMGHTRMTTQGSEKRNYINHPFQARAGGQAFALAHNGVLNNDLYLRKAKKLRRTNIETDSFVAVQLLEQYGSISFDSLRSMAEEVEGSFSFTVLDGRDNVYFIKGDNPLCIYHYPGSGLYLYASTEAILLHALDSLPCQLGTPEQVVLTCGELLRIHANGEQSRSVFDDSRLFRRYAYFPYSFMMDPPSKQQSVPVQVSSRQEYIQSLKSVASFYGYHSGCVDELLNDGFTLDDVEDMLYCGRL